MQEHCCWLNTCGMSRMNLVNRFVGVHSEMSRVQHELEKRTVRSSDILFSFVLLSEHISRQTLLTFTRQIMTCCQRLNRRITIWTRMIVVIVVVLVRIARRRGGGTDPRFASFASNFGDGNRFLTQSRRGRIQIVAGTTVSSDCCVPIDRCVPRRDEARKIQ